ncbi:unnamed protein product [Ilex paraguariensis]|uniref:Uncharacterized protein n=1 Tax=Ilex paraguariensis TaxID=185542 RepID=A0ABC8T144_9AQUA
MPRGGNIPHEMLMRPSYFFLEVPPSQVTVGRRCGGSLKVYVSLLFVVDCNSLWLGVSCSIVGLIVLLYRGCRQRILVVVICTGEEDGVKPNQIDPILFKEFNQPSPPASGSRQFRLPDTFSGSIQAFSGLICIGSFLFSTGSFILALTSYRSAAVQLFLAHI